MEERYVNKLRADWVYMLYLRLRARVARVVVVVFSSVLTLLVFEAFSAFLSSLNPAPASVGEMGLGSGVFSFPCTVSPPSSTTTFLLPAPAFFFGLLSTSSEGSSFTRRVRPKAFRTGGGAGSCSSVSGMDSTTSTSLEGFARVPRRGFVATTGRSGELSLGIESKGSSSSRCSTLAPRERVRLPSTGLGTADEDEPSSSEGFFVVRRLVFGSG